jgi:hypothetical protein
MGGEDIEYEELNMPKPSGYMKNGILIWVLVLILLALFFLG